MFEAINEQVILKCKTTGDLVKVRGIESQRGRI